MKKIIAGLLIVLMLAFSAQAADFAKYSGQQTADAAITAQGGLLYGIIVTSDAAATGSVLLYDHATAASGSQILPKLIFSASTTDKTQTIIFPAPIKFYNGIYADITTSGGSVYYEVYWKND